jgi:electron transport complex protein RnfC
MGLFPKGIKLPRSLNNTTFNLIELPLPERVILPLKQYIGEPAQPCVSVGDEVKVGQLIGTADGDSALPLHATISGKVVDIKEHLDPKGSTVPSIIIEGDGTDTWIEPPAEEKDMDALGPSDILKRIHGAGLVAKGLLPIPLGRDLLPLDQPKTHLYLNGTKVVKKIDSLLINALDIEPSLGVNRYLARIHNEELASGISALKVITGAQRTLFVVDKKSPPYPQLESIVLADEEESTTLISIDGERFPVGLSVPLLKTVLGREVPLPYGHPRDVGAAIYDIDTVVSIGRSVHKQIPQVESLITVGGGALSKGGIVKVRIGTQIGVLIESLDGLKEDPAKIILGGLMMGMAQYDLTIPITKDIPGLFVLIRDEIQVTGRYRECINCGLCVRVCPVNLVPGMLSMYCARDCLDMAEREGLFTCIECGCCDYVCPSRRPMLHLFRHAKHQLMEAA